MKITRATLKSFIKKNQENLFVKSLSDFDGMVDCVMPTTDEYRKVTALDFTNEHTLGIRGLWLVGSSRDYFTAFEDENYKGFEVYNCCGKSLVVIKK